ncbi:MAG: hypothetical protein PHG23_00970 [Candidatus Pacebacteria bacterium]|nr:hypothetical protein [Candidatus Paceibacterota bacterium]
MQDSEKIKSALLGAKRIVIAIKSNPDNDALGAALAVFFALQKIGKTASIHSLTGQNPAEELNNILRKDSQEQILFSFQGSVSEVSYEKSKNEINLFVTPKAQPVKDDSFVCRTVSDVQPIQAHSLNPFDALICLGINNYAEIESAFSEDPETLFQCDIINIDNDPNNNHYADMNAVENYPCLSQTTACLIYELGESFWGKKTADALLFGLFSSPQNAKTDKNIPTIRWLTQLGGNIGMFLRSAGKSPSPETRLLEKVIRNGEIKGKTKGVFFSSLTAADFSEAGATSKELGFVSEKLKSFFRLNSFLLFWEIGGKKVRGLIYSDNPEIVKKFNRSYPGDFKNNKGIFASPETSLKNALRAAESLLP